MGNNILVGLKGVMDRSIWDFLQMHDIFTYQLFKLNATILL